MTCEKHYSPAIRSCGLQRWPPLGRALSGLRSLSGLRVLGVAIVLCIGSSYSAGAQTPDPPVAPASPTPRAPASTFPTTSPETPATTVTPPPAADPGTLTPTDPTAAPRVPTRADAVPGLMGAGDPAAATPTRAVPTDATLAPGAAIPRPTTAPAQLPSTGLAPSGAPAAPTTDLPSGGLAPAGSPTPATVPTTPSFADPNAPGALPGTGPGTTPAAGTGPGPTVSQSDDVGAPGVLTGLPAAALADLSLEQVTDWVMREHPLAIAAAAVEARGPAELLAARGAFDPNVRADFERKEYLGTEYFEYADAGLSWQTPYAVKVETGRQWADGTYFNPERRVPEAGQAYLAVKLPLLQGLITDKYRLGVQQGRLAVDLNRAAAEVIRNELRYDIATAYLSWAYAARILGISRETESLIRQRLADTRQLYLQGDKPAIDTLEAAIGLANQTLLTQQALVDITVAGQGLRALYFVLPEGAAPDLRTLRPQLPVDTAVLARHPALRELRAAVAQQELQRRLYREYRKPRLDVSYSILGDGFDLTPADDPEDSTTDFLTSAYKVGVSFRYPILNRTARGQLQVADLKVAETGAKLEAKRQELDAKARANLEAARAFERQLAAVETLVEQTRALLQAERELFSLGESTQFLLNSREQSLQKALFTLAKLDFSRAKAIFAYRQATATWE